MLKEAMLFSGDAWVPSRSLDGDGRADRAEADVGVDDLGAGVVGLDVRGHTRRRVAGATGCTGLAGLLGRVGRVKPQHVGVVLHIVNLPFLSQIEQLTSSQMDMTRTMGTLRAELSWSKPPTSAKRSRSSKALNWAVQNSGVMALLSFGMPSQVGAGISIFLPPWTKNWVSLFSLNWVTTVNFLLVSTVLPLP